MSQTKTFSNWDALPIVRNTCGISHWMSWQYWPRDDEHLFHIRHSNGDYLITLFSILEILGHVKNNPDLNVLINTGGFLPPIDEHWWWKTLHTDSSQFFGLSPNRFNERLKGIFVGVQFRCYHLSEWEYEPIMFEVKDDDSNTHTLSLSVLTKILYVSVRFLRLLPELEVDPKLVGEKNWFKLAFKRFSKHPKKSNLLMSSRYFSAEQTTLPLVSSEDFSVKDWNYV